MAEELEQLQESGPAALGGSMLLVDLAGADYDHRDGLGKAQQKESTAINQSLLALKECFRSIASTNNKSATNQQQPQVRPPFRRSKLTRILEDSLAPRPETSRRRNKESTCVMVVNVSPASNLKNGTVNALRYGQLFAAGGSRNINGSSEKASSNGDSAGADGGPPKSSSSSRMARLRKQAKENLQQSSSNDPDVDPEIWKRKVREIYSAHVPEKTKEEVEEILGKFSGREQVLLERVEAKYTVQIHV